MHDLRTLKHKRAMREYISHASEKTMCELKSVSNENKRAQTFHLNNEWMNKKSRLSRDAL